MPLIDLMDETYVAAGAERVAAAVADSSWWVVTWPELDLTVAENRGVEGIRWRVSGALNGTAEVWLEEFRGRGVIVHYFLRANPRRAPRSGRAAQRLRRHYTLRWKAHAFALKDTLESTRRS